MLPQNQRLIGEAAGSQSELATGEVDGPPVPLDGLAAAARDRDRYPPTRGRRVPVAPFNDDIDPSAADLTRSHDGGVIAVRVNPNRIVECGGTADAYTSIQHRPCYRVAARGRPDHRGRGSGAGLDATAAGRQGTSGTGLRRRGGLGHRGVDTGWAGCVGQGRHRSRRCGRGGRHAWSDRPLRRRYRWWWLLRVLRRAYRS